MMLFVFHVDRGTMMTFNMQAALYTVGELKERIHQVCKIPPEKQVLLVSGGRGLYSENKVCSYLGGTDSNPIFLFYKYGMSDVLQPAEDAMHKSESEILAKVQAEVKDPEMSHTVVARRAALAEHLHAIAEDYLAQCKSLVHDQHLQQQGWMAVVANLEDTAAEFKLRADSYEDTFDHYYSSYGEYVHLVQGFTEDLKLLHKIPLLPALLSDKDIADRDDEDISNDEEDIPSDPMKPTSLLDYITSSENNEQMEHLHNMCTDGLQQFDEKVHNGMRKDITDVLVLVDDPEMKEVKGLGERLYGLDKLIRDGENCVLEQKQQTKSFTSNNLTIARTGERSIIPDLCSSHTMQLQTMATTHQKLCDIRRRIVKAKEELSANLVLRLKWVMYVENKILETSQKLFVCHENLKRLCRQLDMLHQIHNAPTLYLNGISEVVRRKAFSKAFLLWASDLACRMMTIHNDEKARRKDFAAAAEGHFLATLFPDSSDAVPAFAVEPPSLFDSGLPDLSEEDVQDFKDSLPEALRDEFKLYDLSTVMEFFAVKEAKGGDSVRGAAEGSQTMDVGEPPDFTVTMRNVSKSGFGDACVAIAAIPHLKDLDKGGESETDTEEFEKVCQSPLELHFDHDAAAVTSSAVAAPRATQDVGVATEDNLQTSRTEYDRVKGSLTQLSSVTQQALANLRRELSNLREYFIAEQSALAKQCGDLTESWEQISSGNEVKDKQIATLISDQNQLLDGFKRELDLKTEEINSLRQENALLDGKNKDFYTDNCFLRRELDNFKTEAENSRRCLAEKDAERERVVQSVREECRAEVDALRSRFKMVTESSPTSDQAWAAELEARREDRVREAVAAERSKWERIVEDMNVRGAEEFARERHLLSVSIEEKDNLVRQLRTEVEQLRRLHREQPDVMECRTDDLHASAVEVSEASRGETDPAKLKDSLTASQLSLINSKNLSVSRCNIGDLVLVLWNPQHGNFKIVQERTTMYFLHSDSLLALGLRRGDDSKPYAWGEVTAKFYCQARKPQNRYNVQVGTKFYMVKVKPIRLSVVDESKEAATTTGTEKEPSSSSEAALAMSVQEEGGGGENPSERTEPDQAAAMVATTTTPASSARTSMTCSFSIHSPESLPMDTSTGSNRTHTFTYCLTDPWIGGSAWIDNS